MVGACLYDTEVCTVMHSDLCVCVSALLSYAQSPGELHQRRESVAQYEMAALLHQLRRPHESQYYYSRAARVSPTGLTGFAEVIAAIIRDS